MLLGDENSFRLLVESIKDCAIIMLDPDGHVVTWNAGAENFKGYRAEEIIGKDFSCFYPPEAIERGLPEQELKKAAKDGRFEDEGWRMRKDGKKFWASVIISALRDKDGTLQGFSKVTRDLRLTLERNKAEKALQDTKERLASIIISAMDAIITVGNDQRIVLFNGAAEKMFRCPAQEAMGEKIDRFIPTRFRPAHGEHLREFGETGVTSRNMGALGVISGLRADGEEFPIEAAISQVEVAGEILFTVVLRDITERKKAEEALRESESRFRQIAESLPQLVWTCQPEGPCDYLSRQWVEFTGLPAAQQLGFDWFNQVHPEDRAGLSGSWNLAVSRGGAFQFEFRLRRHDGVFRWFDTRAAPLRDALGKIVKWFGTNTDITDRKRAEEELRTAHDHLRRFIDSNIVGIIITNAAGEILEANDYYLRMIGATREELQESKIDWRAITPPEWLPADEKAIMELRERGTCTPYEKEYIRRDGTRVPVFLADTMLPGPDEKIAAFALDITERKKAEPALRESEEGFRTMADTIPQLAWIAKADGYIFWYNQRFYEYTGMTPAQMEGWGWQSVHDPEMLPKVMVRWKDAINTGKPFEMEFPLRGADGRFRTFLTRVHPLKNPAGQVLQWFGTNTDVDELKRIEEKVRLLNADLEQRVHERTAQLEATNKELEAFSYSVSHDLRAPVRYLAGFADLLAKAAGPALAGKSLHYLNEIQDSAKQMGCLIDDLLLFSRMGRAEMRFQPVDMKRLVEEVQKQLAPEINGRDIRWKLRSLPEVQADGALLRQVMLNLLSNAVKFTRPRQPAEIEIGCDNSSREETVIFVRDNGVGFEMEYANQLFGVFQRLHLDDEFDGTGIGLASVQRIVNRHGGRTWAEGRINAGATFYFSLPKNPSST